PSSHGRAIADAAGIDIGDVGRNILRGPAQRNIDIAVTRRFPFGESSNAELRAEFFNLFNHVNLANPISNINAVAASAFSNTGAIVVPGDFGRIFSTSSNPRLVQLALKLHWSVLPAGPQTLAMVIRHQLVAVHRTEQKKWLLRRRESFVAHKIEDYN